MTEQEVRDHIAWKLEVIFTHNKWKPLLDYLKREVSQHHFTTYDISGLDSMYELTAAPNAPEGCYCTWQYTQNLCEAEGEFVKTWDNPFCVLHNSIEAERNVKFHNPTELLHPRD